MVQRNVEMVAGMCASALGFVLLFYLLLWPSIDSRYSYFSQSHDLAWLPAFLAYVAVLAAIALGVLLQGIPTLTRAGYRTRMAFAWSGRVALWFSTLGLMVLIYLSAASIGLIFIPSAVLALIACVLALIPGPAPNANN